MSQDAPRAGLDLTQQTVLPPAELIQERLLHFGLRQQDAAVILAGPLGLAAGTTVSLGNVLRLAVDSGDELARNDSFAPSLAAVVPTSVALALVPDELGVAIADALPDFQRQYAAVQAQLRAMAADEAAGKPWSLD